jgi:hypothetical protein
MISPIDLNSMLSDAVDAGMDYNTYRSLVDDLMREDKSTGHIQNEDMLNYSKLSVRRMKRWDKTFKLTAEDKNYLENFETPVCFLVITEGWCGDAAHALPVLNKVVEAAPGLEMKLVLRDDNDSLISEFLTNGGKSIPKLIALDQENNVLFTWGPRPTEATTLVEDYKTQHGQLTPEFKEDLQKWYNKDKGQNIVKDIVGKLEAL